MIAGRYVVNYRCWAGSAVAAGPAQNAAVRCMADAEIASHPVTLLWTWPGVGLAERGSAGTVLLR